MFAEEPVCLFGAQCRPTDAGLCCLPTYRGVLCYWTYFLCFLLSPLSALALSPCDPFPVLIPLISFLSRPFSGRFKAELTGSPAS